MRASSTSCAEGAPPAADRRHGSVGVAADSAGVAVTRRRHRVAVGRVRELGGVRHLRTQQLGARHSTGAYAGGGKVQRARRQVRRRCPGVRRVGDVDVIAGEAVVRGAEAGMGAERQSRVWVGMSQGR